MNKYPQKFFYALLGLMVSTTYAVDIYVAPNGSGLNSGTAGQPVASLVAAQQKARPYAGKETVTVHVADGIYYLPETLVFTPEDSGSEKFPIVKTPSFEPKPKTESRARKRSFALMLLGAEINGLRGAEFSAYGVSQADGGVVFTGFSKKTEAYRAGFYINDLIQEINGMKVRDPDDLLTVTKKNRDNALIVKFVRNQQTREITLKPQELPVRGN